MICTIDIKKNISDLDIFNFEGRKWNYKQDISIALFKLDEELYPDHIMERCQEGDYISKELNKILNIALENNILRDINTLLDFTDITEFAKITFEQWINLKKKLKPFFNSTRRRRGYNFHYIVDDKIQINLLIPFKGPQRKMCAAINSAIKTKLVTEIQGALKRDKKSYDNYFSKEQCQIDCIESNFYSLYKKLVAIDNRPKVILYENLLLLKEEDPLYWLVEGLEPTTAYYIRQWM